MCSVAYVPCSNDSFRIGSWTKEQNETLLQATPSTFAQDYEDEGSGLAEEIGSQETNKAKKCRDRVMIPCDFEEFITVINLLFCA